MSDMQSVIEVVLSIIEDNVSAVDAGSDGETELEINALRAAAYALATYQQLRALREERDAQPAATEVN